MKKIWNIYTTAGSRNEVRKMWFNFMSTRRFLTVYLPSFRLVLIFFDTPFGQTTMRASAPFLLLSASRPKYTQGTQLLKLIDRYERKGEVNLNPPIHLRSGWLLQIGWHSRAKFDSLKQDLPGATGSNKHVKLTSFTRLCREGAKYNNTNRLNQNSSCRMPAAYDIIDNAYYRCCRDLFDKARLIIV